MDRNMLIGELIVGIPTDATMTPSLYSHEMGNI
jgi:hypothetical protein